MCFFLKLLHSAELIETNCPVPRVPPSLLQAPKHPCLSFTALRNRPTCVTHGVQHVPTLTPFGTEGGHQISGVHGPLSSAPADGSPAQPPPLPSDSHTPTAPGSPHSRRQQQHIRIHHTTLTWRLAGYHMTMHFALMHKFEAM